MKAALLRFFLRAFLWLLRSIWPIPSLFGWAVALRYDDAVEVLERSDVFAVPFGGEIARLNDGAEPGTAFILGIDDPDEHLHQLELVVQAFRRADVAAIVAPVSRTCAERTLDGVRRVDAISMLITGVPLEICRAYYGIEIDDPRRFAHAASDVSGHLFGPPPIRPRPNIDVAADYLRSVVDASIERQKKGATDGDTVLARLVAAHGHQNPLVRAFLIGMIVGFVPTNTLAGGHILEMLLSKPKWQTAARAHAFAGDDDLLGRCLLEALRFMPINFGPFRVCARDHLLAAGTPRATWIRAGTKVLACTPSAMFDSRQILKPCRFNPRRAASDYLHFGYGMHWCAGFHIAQAQIVQTFKALLMRPTPLRRVRGPQGRLKRRGGFPDQLHVEWGV